jgi:hypothetical protein
VAVSVEGTFRIIDRASRTLENIERRAKAADRAVEKLGRSLDKVTAKEHIEGLSKLDANMAKVTKSATAASREIDRQSRVLDTHKRKVDSSGTALERFGKKMILVFGGLGKVFALMKLPLMIGGFAQLIPLVAALGAGVVSLLPKIGQLGALLGALPATFAGLGLAMATVKLAFSDISKAMGGNADALARLTPAARRFTETLKSWKPLVDEFRKSAQGGLFKGLDASLERLKTAAPTVNRLLTMMGNTLGKLAQQASARFTSRSFLADFLSIGQQGGRIVSRMGRGLMNLVDALRHVAVAARPFTDWLTLTLYRWTRWIDAAAKAGRETGKLQAFFARARTTLEQFGRIVQNVYFALRDMLRAATPLGETLWGGIERATRAWRDFAESVRGQTATRRFFDSTRDTLVQIWGLVQDVTKALGRLGANQGGAAALVGSLRGLVGPLERILTNFQKAFGPEVGVLLTNIARTMELLSGNMVGPFTVALRLLNRILGVFNSLLDAVPRLGQAILVAFAVSRIMRMAGAVRALAASWGLVGAAAGRAAAAEAAATMMGGAGGGGPGIFGRIFGRGKRPPVPRGGVPDFAAGPAGMARAEGAVGAAAKVGGLGRIAGGAARGIGKFAWPIAAGMAALDAYSAERTGGFWNQAAQSGSAALTGATFGAIPQYSGGAMEAKRRQDVLTNLATAAEPVQVAKRSVAPSADRPLATAARAHGVSTVVAPVMQQSYAQQVTATTAANPTTAQGQAGQIAALQGIMARARGEKAAADNEAMKALISGLQTELTYREEILKTTRSQERTDKRRATATYSAGLTDKVAAGVDPVTGKLKNAKRTRAELRAATALDIRQMSSADPAQARKTGLARIAADNAMLKAHPELKGQVDRDQKDILRKFDKLGIDIKAKGKKIVDNTAEGVKGLAKALAAPGEQVAQLVDAAMTTAQAKYVQHMRDLGYTPQQAKAFVATGESTGSYFLGGDPVNAKGQVQSTAQPSSKRARGGRIPGSGLMDTVPIAPGQMAAPGELVVNRHTEGRINRLLSMMGTSLGREVAREDKPHWAGEDKSGVMPGLAKGGRTRPAPRGPGTLDLTGGQSGGSPLARAMRAANAIDSMHYPYAWGGGHGRIGVPSSGTRHSTGGPMGVGFDCSGATSAVLGAAGLLGGPQVASSFMRWGAKGYDPHGINVVASPSHVYMMLAGRAFGTSTANPSGGAGWFPGGIRSGFSVNHVANPGSLGDVGSAVGGGGAGGALRLTATNSGLFGFPGAYSAGATGAQAGALNKAAAAADTAGSLGFAKGGRVGFGGWFGRGGTATYDRPTLIGVGDSGRETVSVSRGGGGGGGPTFVVKIGHITNHGGNVQREIEAAFQSLARRLETQGLVDDAEVMT